MIQEKRLKKSQLRADDLFDYEYLISNLYNLWKYSP